MPRTAFYRKYDELHIFRLSKKGQSQPFSWTRRRLSKEELSEEVQVYSLNMEEFVRGDTKAYNTSSQQAVAVLKTRTESRRSQSCATVFTATDDFLFVQSGDRAGSRKCQGVHGDAILLQPVMLM